jgi:hypothetical protein
MNKCKRGRGFEVAVRLKMHLNVQSKNLYTCKIFFKLLRKILNVLACSENYTISNLRKEKFQQRK